MLLLFVNVTLIIFCRYQVTVCGQKALELLLESYGFFPTLQALVQTQSLLKLKEGTPLPITKSINSCLLQEGSCNDESSNKDVSAKVAVHVFVCLCLFVFVCNCICI